MTLPTLTTARLRLRPFTPADAPAVQRLAGAREVAATTLAIPHPYPDGAAEAWIATHAAAFAERRAATFAVTLHAGGELIGAIGLGLAPAHARAELGYWVGVPFWGQGYCTEAGHAMLEFGFRELGLNRVHAHHFTHNPASGAVMRKLGMRYEGRMRQHVCKWGDLLDVDCYAILRAEWAAAARPASAS